MLLIFGFSPQAAPAQTGSSFQGRVVGIDSGDQIRVKLAELTIIVRLHGITCPTSPLTLQAVARNYTSRRVLNGRVRVDVKGTGPNQTFYGEVMPPTGKNQKRNRESLNEELVRVGLAEWAQDYAPSRTELGELQIKAQTQRRGMWGDRNGANIILPTPVPSTTPTPQRSPSPTPASIPSPSPSPTTQPSAIAPTTTPHPTTTASPPVKPPLAKPPPFAVPAHSSFGDVSASPKPPLLLGMGLGFAAAATAAFLFLRKNAGFSGELMQNVPQAAGGAAALPAPSGSAAGARGQVPLVPALGFSVCVGFAGSLLVPFPLLLAVHQFAPTSPAVIALIALPLLFVCVHFAVTWTRREQILRSAPRLKNDGEGGRQQGVVKIEGQSVVASTDVVYSVVGRIPGLYVREVTSRYEVQTAENGSSTAYTRKGKRPNARWVVQHQDIRTTDFFVAGRDQTPVRVASEWAEFYPLRIARYYNEIPVDSWFNQAYVGDTRTEIHFLPARVPVTVWGQVRKTATPIPGQEENRMGYDASHDCLIVVEGDPARLWTRRPLLGLLMTFAGIGLAGLVAYCLLTPTKAFPL